MKCRALVPVGFLLAITGTDAISAPSLNMPVQAGEFWVMTRGYDQSSHVNYTGPETQDRYALDFAQGGCNALGQPNAYGKSAIAVADGAVEFAGYSGDYGNTVIVDHGDGYKSRSAHLSSIGVSVGQSVQRGQEIGKIGNTGNVEGTQCSTRKGTHLHFAMYHNGQAYKPEPMGWYTGIGDVNDLVYFSSNVRIGQENADTFCKENFPDPRVERFRASNGGLVVNMCPSDGLAYYYTSTLCSIAYVDLVADGSGGYAICGGDSDDGNENYSSDPTQGAPNGDGSSTEDSDPTAPVDLKFDVDYYGKDGEKWNTSRPAIPGMQIAAKAHVWAEEGNAGNWNPDGSDYIQICYYAELDNGDWIQWAQGQIHIGKLDEGRMDLSETKWYTVPEGYQTLDFRVKIDCTNKVVETDEHNTSEEKHYLIEEAKPNLTPTNVFLSNADDGTKVYNGDHILEDQYWHMYCDIESNGETDSPIGVKVSHKIDGEERYTDTLGIDEIHVGETATEVAWDDMKLGDTGPRTQECCVDSGNWLPETNESDNCKTMHFTVDPWKSDITVADLYLVTDTGQVVRDGSSIPENSYVRPYCVLTNQGNRNVQNGIRLKYEVDAGNYRGDDGLDKADLTIGAEKTEYMSDGFRLGDTGPRTFRCIGDYEDSEHELNENNNQATISFTVYKAVPQITIIDQWLTYRGYIVGSGGTGKRKEDYSPNVVFKNTGTANMACGAEVEYYVDSNKYRGRDGVDPLSINQTGHEYMSNKFRLGDGGWRYYRVRIKSNCGEFTTVERTIPFYLR